MKNEIRKTKHDLRIYFACAIRGGREGAEIYPEIIELLKQYGQILTEWFGAQKLSSLGEDYNAKFVHDRDLELVLQADVIVAETTHPSHGVGYEIGRALEHNKRVLCLYRPQPGKRLSAMLEGNDQIMIKEYNDLTDIKKAIEQFFQ